MRPIKFPVTVFRDGYHEAKYLMDADRKWIPFDDLAELLNRNGEAMKILLDIAAWDQGPAMDYDASMDVFARLHKFLADHAPSATGESAAPHKEE